MKKQENIHELRQRLSKVNKEKHLLEAKIKQFEENIDIEDLQTRYEGKYFVYINFEEEEIWATYYYCKEITPEGEVIVDFFESSEYGSTFGSDIEADLFFLETEVSKEEFMNKKALFELELEKIGNE